MKPEKNQEEVAQAKLAKLTEDRKILVLKMEKIKRQLIDIETDIAYLEQLTTTK